MGHRQECLCHPGGLIGHNDRSGQHAGRRRGAASRLAGLRRTLNHTAAPCRRLNDAARAVVVSAPPLLCVRYKIITSCRRHDSLSHPERPMSHAEAQRHRGCPRAARRRRTTRGQRGGRARPNDAPPGFLTMVGGGFAMKGSRRHCSRDHQVRGSHSAATQMRLSDTPAGRGRHWPTSAIL